MFPSNITPVKVLNYWERLQALSIYTIERCWNRYFVIEVWKIIEDHVPNYGIKEYLVLQLANTASFHKYQIQRHE